MYLFRNIFYWLQWGKYKKTVSSIQSNNTSKNEEPITNSNHNGNEVMQIAPKAVASVNGSIKLYKSVTNKLIRFDGEKSYDPDGNNRDLSYKWTNLNSNTISNKKSFVHRYNKKGLYEITLTVTDAQNLTAIDRICVLVDIDKNDIPLIVKAGEDQKVKENEQVSLNGRLICRDDIFKYEWREGEKLLSTKANFTTSFKAGRHVLVLTVVDLKENKSTDSVVVNTM